MLTKKCNKQIYLILVVLFFYSCTQNIDYRIVPSRFSNDKITLDTSYLEIEIDSNNRLFEYKVSSSTPQGIYCGYNPKLNSLDFFDLRVGKQMFQSKLEVNGLNKIEGVIGCYIVNIDSIFLLTNKKIVLVNKFGKIQNSIKINSSSEEPFFKENYILEFDRSKNFSYDSSRKKILATSLSAKGMDRKNAYYLSPITEITFGNKIEFKNTPISWSSLYKENLYGFLTTSFVSFDKDNIILSFPIEPNIYVFNENTKKNITVGGSPGFKNIGSPIAKPLSHNFRYNDDKKILHYFENIVYGKVIVDVVGKFYYRIVNLALEGRDKGIQNFDKRKSFLTVYNRNFEILKTMNLNDQRYVRDAAFSTEIGLLIPCPHRANSLRFKIFNFNNK